MTLWLDSDGVVFNFNKRANQILGTHCESFENQFGSVKFWEKIASDPEFYLNLEPMEDFDLLYGAVKHLNPLILTGLPFAIDPNLVEAQKREAFRRLLGPDTEVFVCYSRDKYKFCQPGDILIDDRVKYKHLWEKAGGIYIVHTSASDTIKQLKELNIL